VYDAVVVGARCAGSPTAMLLARKGYRVLLLDKATFPSAMPMSTHLIHQPGIARLKRWGLRDRLPASHCSPVTHYQFDLGACTLTGCPPPAEDTTEAYAPRRTILDKILVEAAVEAGVELREAFAVQELVREGEQVVGIRGHTPGGSNLTEKARIVIGADGMHSLVARAVHAPEYKNLPPLQETYFAYWSGVSMKGLEFYPRAYRAAYGWPTHDNLVLVGVNWVARDFAEVRADIEGHFFQVLDMAAPDLAVRLREGRRESRWIGGSINNYFRKPYGSGWALVGDAGYKKDPGTAAGITDAFRDAELLVQAIDDGFSERQPLVEALAGYERKRNEAAMPVYEFTCEIVRFEPPTLEQQHLFNALRNNQKDTNRFFGLIARLHPSQSSSRRRISNGSLKEGQCDRSGRGYKV